MEPVNEVTVSLTKPEAALVGAALAVYIRHMEAQAASDEGASHSQGELDDLRRTAARLDQRLRQLDVDRGNDVGLDVVQAEVLLRRAFDSANPLSALAANAPLREALLALVPAQARVARRAGTSASAIGLAMDGQPPDDR